MKWSEAVIGNYLSRVVFQRKLVIIPNCMWTGYEADLLAVGRELKLVDIEIKISRADLKADAGKDKWWHSKPWALMKPGDWGKQKIRCHREWPVKVWKHYYCLPADIWKPELLASLGSSRSGVITVAMHASGNFMTHEVVRRAQADREAKAIDPADAIDLARLANLRMWDAYAELDRVRAPAAVAA
ncbi:MAG TPA: hypothetical protein VN667_17980 [Burkholderiales bacterium]|nr:hypothetical protein [Burkholderiales bacterium]